MRGVGSWAMRTRELSDTGRLEAREAGPQFEGFLSHLTPTFPGSVFCRKAHCFPALLSLEQFSPLPICLSVSRGFNRTGRSQQNMAAEHTCIPQSREGFLMPGGQGSSRVCGRGRPLPQGHTYTLREAHPGFPVYPHSSMKPSLHVGPGISAVKAICVPGLLSSHSGGLSRGLGHPPSTGLLLIGDEKLPTIAECMKPLVLLSCWISWPRVSWRECKPVPPAVASPVPVSLCLPRPSKKLQPEGPLPAPLHVLLCWLSMGHLCAEIHRPPIPHPHSQPGPVERNRPCSLLQIS